MFGSSFANKMLVGVIPSVRCTRFVTTISA